MLPVRQPLQTAEVVRLLGVRFAKLHAGQSVDLDPLQLVDFTVLRARLRAVVKRLNAGIRREALIHRRDVHIQRRRITATRRAPDKRLRLTLHFGPVGWDSERHALAIPLDLLTSCDRRGLCGSRLPVLSGLRACAATGCSWTRI